MSAIARCLILFKLKKLHFRERLPARLRYRPLKNQQGYTFMSFKPSASLETIRQRSNILKNIRAFFEARGYLEIETPIASRHGVTDPYLANLCTTFRNEPYYLQTSPEYHMKRLLAVGSGPIFQIARVFRDDELGRWHQPEFSMLEWYQPHATHLDLMKETGDLIEALSGSQTLIVKTYQEVFLESCEIDPFSASIFDFQEVLARFNLQNVLDKDEQDRDQYLYLLMTHVVEPYLAEMTTSPVAVYAFPPSQAMLAQVENNVASRFEIYWKGIELANGFHELTDPELQLARFKKDNERRREKGLPEMLIDMRLIEALKIHPPASGVALGIDRLIALILEKTSLSSVITFDWSRC